MIRICCNEAHSFGVSKIEQKISETTVVCVVVLFRGLEGALINAGQVLSVGCCSAEIVPDDHVSIEYHIHTLVLLPCAKIVCLFWRQLTATDSRNSNTVEGLTLAY